MNDLRDPAPGEGALDEVTVGRRAVGGGVKIRVIDRLEQSLPARGAVVGHRHVHEVPVEVAAIHLPAELLEPAVVPFNSDPDAGPLRERLEIRLDLAVFVRTSP